MCVQNWAHPRDNNSDHGSLVKKKDSHTDHRMLMKKKIKITNRHQSRENDSDHESAQKKIMRLNFSIIFRSISIFLFC